MLTRKPEDLGMAAAARFLAAVIRARAAAMPSLTIPPTIRSYVRMGIGYITAGGAGGREAPAAYMFETPGARHPLFAHGPRGTDGWKRWYDQPYRPFMEEAVEMAADKAAEIYADVTIEQWAREIGAR